MSSQKTQKWLDAAKILREDPDKRIICPNCNVGYLQVKDVIVKEEKKCDRYLICDNCKAYNVITFAL